jgi:hypothetical protein
MDVNRIIKNRLLGFEPIFITLGNFFQYVQQNLTKG